MFDMHYDEEPETEDKELSLFEGILSELDTHPLTYPNRSKYAVAHTSVEQSHPARQMSETPGFTASILKIMDYLKMYSLTGVQTHTWPHLSLGDDHGLYMIAPPLSGRTLGVLMPLCQTVSTVISERAAQLPNDDDILGPGPVAILVAADVPQVERIEQLCKLMMRNLPHSDWITLVATISTTDYANTLVQLLNTVGCLVVTLAQFLCLKKFAECIKYPELRFVVFDDVDKMEPSLLMKAFPFLLDVVKKSMQHHAQLVLTSQFYDSTVLQHLRAFNKYPMVVFGDVLEASYYGGVPMKLRLLKSSEKLGCVLQILRLRPPSQLRTMIYCNSDSEIEEVKKCLIHEGYKCLAYYLAPSGLAVWERVQSWHLNTMSEVLVTADCPELSIRNVHTLIHYNMSDTWTTFKMRYLVFTNNLRNHLKPNSASTPDLYSLVLLDETNTVQLPRLTDYLKLHQSDVPEHIAVVAQRIRDEKAANKSDEPPLCPQLMGYGNCKLARCPNRHRLVEYDRSLPDWLPASGDVRFSMQKIYSPVHYSVRLFEFKAEHGDWLKLEELDVTMKTHIRLQMYMNIDKNRVLYWPPTPREVCVCQEGTTIYERVRILTVPHIQTKNLVSFDLKVEVQSMDTDRRTFWTTSGSLFVCPKLFLDKPPMSFDMRLVGLVPSSGERSWYEKDTELVREWLRNLPTDSVFQAKVLFSTSHTIFVEEVAALKYAPNMRVHVQQFNMRQKLCDKLAKTCPSTKSLVLATFKEHISQLRARERFRLNAAHSKHHDSIEDIDKQQEQQQQQSESAAETATNSESQTTVQATDIVEQELTPEDIFSFNIFNWLSGCQEQQENPKVEKVEATEQQKETNFDSNTQISHPVRIRPEPQAESAEQQEVAHFDINTIISRPAYKNPEIIYYQTIKTLELQVKLPRDDIEYTLTVSRTVVYFLTQNHDPQYGFCINTRFMYSSYKEKLQGCTLYISINKSLVQPYPLCFENYKFMKPNHDKMDSIENSWGLGNFPEILSHYMLRPNDNDDDEQADGSSSQNEESDWDEDPVIERSTAGRNDEID